MGMSTMTTILLLLLVALSSSTNAFVHLPTTSRIASSRLNFGIPTFGAKDDDKKEKKTDDKKIGISGLIQVITAGMGAPFLGEFEGVDEETGKMMFSLEANNLVDEVRACEGTSVSLLTSTSTLSLCNPLDAPAYRTATASKPKCRTLKAVGLIQKTSRKKKPEKQAKAVASSSLGTVEHSLYRMEQLPMQIIGTVLQNYLDI
jgi:hypothetical protein